MNGPLGSTISDKRVIYAWLCKKYSERNCEHKPHFTPTTFSLYKGQNHNKIWGNTMFMRICLYFHSKYCI